MSAYRGYLIEPTTDGKFSVQKDGHKVYTALTVVEAQQTIDMLVDDGA